MADHQLTALDHRLKDETGKRYGRLMVLSFHSSKPVRWLCQCDCGNTTVVRAANLRRGMTISCGCYRKDSLTKHGGWLTPEYRIWRGIMDRCFNKNKPKEYSRYGARGITVSQSWINFSNFRRDMGPRPSPIHTVERKDNNKGYSADNCRWATMLEQGQNRRTTRYLDYNGEKLTVRQIMQKTKCPLKFTTVNMRVSSGWSIEDALNQPFRKHRR